MTRRPNILIVQADQFTAQAVSVYGGVARAPRMSALAETATVFENAYCNYPLCAPSRFSMLTGQLPFAIDAYDNASELPASTPTFAHHLRLAGYRTGLSGKMHFIGPDQLHGFEQRVTTDIYPADFAWLPDWTTRSQNFDPIRTTVEKAGAIAFNMQLAYDEEVTARATRQIFEYAREPDRPFCLVVSLTHPHHPFLAPPAYWERYRDDEIPMPRIGRIADADLDAHSARVRRVIGVEESDVDEHHVRLARHAYFAAIDYFDDKLAAVLDALEAAGFADDTAVIVVADHGEMLGERGLWAKDCFFEWSMRIPLLMKLPGSDGPRRIEAPVSLLDLFPTALMLAGVETNGGIEQAPGHSLTEIASTPAAFHDREVRAEYSAEAADAPLVMIRAGRHKFIQGGTDPTLLFDLVEDPDELRNIADEPDARTTRERLEASVNASGSLAAVDAAVRRSQAERRLVSDALAQGRHTPWDFIPEPDDGRWTVRGRIGAEAVDRRIRIPARGYPPPGE